MIVDDLLQLSWKGFADAIFGIGLPKRPAYVVVDQNLVELVINKPVARTRLNGIESSYQFIYGD